MRASVRESRVSRAGLFSLLGLLSSLAPFITVIQDGREFRLILRRVFLLCIGISWPLLLLSVGLSIWILFSSHRRDVTSPLYASEHGWTICVVSCAFTGAAGMLLLVIAHCIWVYVVNWETPMQLWVVSLVSAGLVIFGLLFAAQVGAGIATLCAAVMTDGDDVVEFDFRRAREEKVAAKPADEMQGRNRGDEVDGVSVWIDDGHQDDAPRSVLQY